MSTKIHPVQICFALIACFDLANSIVYALFKTATLLLVEKGVRVLVGRGGCFQVDQLAPHDVFVGIEDVPDS